MPKTSFNGYEARKVKIYLIIEEGIPIGFFINEVERDEAFYHNFITKKRWGIK